MSAILEKDRKYNIHSWSAQGALNPLVVDKAEGIYFWTEDGRKFADMSSQLVNSNLGHGNKAIVDAICEQAKKIPFMGPAFAMDCRADAAEAVVKASGLKGAKVFSQMQVQNQTKTLLRLQDSSQVSRKYSHSTDAITVHQQALVC